MAEKKNNTIKGNNGKVYNYYHSGCYVEDFNKKTGEFYMRRKFFSGKNKKDYDAKVEAHKEYIKSLKAELNKTAREKQQDRLFGEYVSWYIDNVFRINSAIKPATKTRYINSYRNIFDGQLILYKPIQDITGEDLQEILTNSEYAPSSKEAALKLLRNFYTYTSSMHIAHDITQGLVIPQVNHKRDDQSIEVFTDEELEKFKSLTPLNHRLRFMIIVAMNTGARIAEICALRYDDIDLDNGQIFINKSLAEITPIKGDDTKARVEISSTKTKESKRTIPLDDETRTEFLRHKKWHDAEMDENGYSTEYIFTTKTGELYYKSSLRTALKRLSIKIGVEPRGWHVFRHTYGSDMAAAGVPIQEVCKLLGHSDISVTSRYYVNITSDQKRQASNKLMEYRRAKQAMASA